MAATCPAGHSSGSDDYCDVCGARIEGVAAAPVPAAPAEEPCPDCGMARSGRFCEGCGYDFAVGGGRPSDPTSDKTGPFVRRGAAPGWVADVTVDRDYYETVRAQGADEFTFPPYAPPRQIPLTGEQVRIGRRSVSKGTVPEIDLGEAPLDPGVSHTHAVLLAKPDGSWTLVDPGSANGTTINGGTDPVAVNVEVPLKDGDRLHVGVWTTIIVRRQQ